MFRIPVALLLVLPGLLQAEDLSLDALLREALRSNPEVVAAQKKLEAARQRPSQSSALPETMLSAGWASTGRPWPGAGLGTDPVANAGLMVTQEFPFPGKRKLRGDIAGREADAEFERYQGVQLAVVSRIRQAYYRLAHTYLVRDVLERNRELLTRLLRITEARYSVGKAAQQDVFKAQTQISILATKLVQTDRERAAREAELLSLLNRPPREALGRALIHRPGPPARPLDELYAAAQQNAPPVRFGEKMIERNTLAVNLARKDYLPDYALSGGYYSMGRMANMYQFRVDVRLPTSYFRKQRAAVAEQAYTLAEARKTLEATAQNLAFRIKDEYLLWETAYRLMTLYEETIVPQSSLALESSLASYSTGSVDFLSVLTNFVTMLDYEMNYHDEMLNVHLAQARLEELTGIPPREGTPHP